jgi:O-antigen ligase
MNDLEESTTLGRGDWHAQESLVLAISLVAAVVIVAVGGAATDRESYYLAMLGLLSAGTIVMLTRREPLRFAFLALIVAFPVAIAVVPPGHLGITVFEATSCVLALGVLWSKVFAQGSGVPIFPLRSLLVSWLLLLVCVAFSQDVLISVRATVAIVGLHGFLLFACAELRRASGFERMVTLLCCTTLLIALGLFVDHWTHINLGLRGSNLNQLTYVGGLAVWRAGGFFQDPQRAGAYLSAVLSFLLVLAARNRLHGRALRAIVWLTILAGTAGLTMTVSRGAIVAFALVSTTALVAFNRWSAGIKIGLLASTTVAALVLALVPTRSLNELLPAALTERFKYSAEELAIRQMIWFDTADMFTDHPLTGIGPGAFRSYLLMTRPGKTTYYGIGSAAEAYVPDQPENGYLKVVYEAGIVGSLSLLLLIGDAVRRGIRGVRSHDKESDARTEVIAALCGLSTLAVTFFTLFTVTDSRVAAVFALFLAILVHHSGRTESSPDGE